jgi:uncharacterized protein
MKKLFFISFLLFSIGALAQVENAVPAAPSPARLVVDFTKGKNFITSEQTAFLEKKLVAFDDSTSNQVAVVIVESLGGYSANEYATALGRKWGLGGKQNNNGVVVLISIEPGNRDAYIAIGYGLEGAIPDITAKSIVDNFLIPNLRNGDHFRALDETTDAIIKAAAGEYTAPTGYGSGKNSGFGLKEIIIAIIVIGMIIISMISKGNNGGGYASRRGYQGWWGPTTWGGGGWSGGSGGGGGGFGGFGGGSFGGGGSGGKW